MKISIDRDEMKAILSSAMAARFGGEWECTTAEYSMAQEMEFAQVTPETIAAAARAAEEVAKWEAKIAAEEVDANA